jgi:hypothetical protein
MFDLEQSVAEWRKQMLVAGIKTPVPLEELENHLREEIAEQKKIGIGEPMAFESSVRHIGRADEIQAEFQKAEAVARRKQLLARFALAYALVCYSAIKVMGIHAFMKSPMSLTWRLAGWIDIVLFTVVVASILGWRWSRRVFPLIPSNRIRITIRTALGCLGLGAYFGFRNFILPSSVFTPEQGLVLLLWLWTLLPGLAVIFIGLEDAAKTKHMA